MTKLAQLWANIHQSPVTTILGLIAGAATWLATQPQLAGHVTLSSVGAVIAAAAVALLGAFTSEKPASATTVTTTTTPK